MGSRTEDGSALVVMGCGEARMSARLNAAHVYALVSMRLLAIMLRIPADTSECEHNMSFR
eukprot:scaffold315542_cov49-Tisochrysis_lutea.AAC.1